ncbi:MAG TPA: hypothetical protein VFC21_10855, partial [Bryobacteraceae bacterium]|nr:hypothetical protein [Bryobacteraceae bacterium]
MSGNGNIVFYALDSTGTNHLFTDIGGQVSIADPLGSGPNFTYNGQARINDSGQVAYFGSPDNKTIATHPYLGTTELSTHAGGNIDGLNDAGTVLWSQQDNNGAWSLYTQSGTVATPYNTSLGVLANDGSVAYLSGTPNVTPGAPQQVISGSGAILAEPGSVIGGTSI